MLLSKLLVEVPNDAKATPIRQFCKESAEKVTLKGYEPSDEDMPGRCGAFYLPCLATGHGVVVISNLDHGLTWLSGS